ncbi:hypothetical protein Tco_1544119, partial [Tanacetum coccineum]
MSNRHQELASPEQTASGKDFLNSLMADNLPKTICCAADLLRCYVGAKAFDLKDFKFTKLATTLKRLKRSIKSGIYNVVEHQ